MFIGFVVASLFGRGEAGDEGRLCELEELRGVRGDIDPEGGEVFCSCVFGNVPMS